MEPEGGRPHDAVYLHYLDRELNEAAGHPIRSQEAVRVTRLLVLFTTAELVCGLSALWENDRLGPRALRDFELLLSANQLQTVSSDITQAEFLESRRSAYSHDAERYPRYFTGSEAQTDWAYPTWKKVGGTTRSLVRTLRDWSESALPNGPFKPTNLAVHEPVRRALDQLEWQAVTYSFFKPQLGDLSSSPVAEYVIRRAISAGFTKDHMRHGCADIATGIGHLEYFDSLATDFPYFDVPVLSEIANIVGLSEMLDPEVTDTDSWQRFVLARPSFATQLVVATTRWIVGALYSRETSRAPRGADDPERFRDRHQVRVRMIAALRESARVAERLGPPASSELVENTFQRVHQRLVWLAESLSKRDPLMKGLLDQTREGLALPTIDVVLATVNDVETDALVGQLESAGYHGRPELGAINTYWIYGPIGGATVAHVRSSMGSGGQGGSTLTVVDAIRDLHPGAVIGVGVAFGIDPGKQPIGQLLLSEQLSEYEKARVGTSATGEILVLSRGPRSEASPRLLGRFRDARLTALGIDVKVGEVLSGEKLVDNPGFKAELISRFPEAIGGEMEGAGVQAASGRENVEWLVAKAVCDYASEKSIDKAARQWKAAETSAKAVLHVLELGGLRRRS